MSQRLLFECAKTKEDITVYIAYSFAKEVSKISKKINFTPHQLYYSSLVEMKKMKDALPANNSCNIKKVTKSNHYTHHLQTIQAIDALYDKKVITSDLCVELKKNYIVGKISNECMLKIKNYLYEVMR